MAIHDLLMFPITKGQFTAAQQAEDAIYTSTSCAVTPHGDNCMLFLNINGKFFATVIYYSKEQLDLGALKALKVSAVHNMARVVLNKKLAA